MVHILFEADHRNRASRLALANPGATSALIDMPPGRMPGNLDTLAFWGHGTMVSLCGKDPAQMAELIKKWKQANPDLKTVELITCNARHFVGNEDSYANRLKSALRSGVLSSTRNIKVLGLPVSVGGISNAHSILLADWQSNTWVYITAPGPTDAELTAATNLIKYEQVGGRSTRPRPDGTDVASLANKLVVEHPHRKWSMTYGTFAFLRRTLVEA
jgi:hypothetical protein